MQDARPAPLDASPSACRNCGEKLLGDFCWRCGQEAADFDRPLRSLASEFFDNVLSLDSKLLRTIVPLLFRPGRLTREYLAGRRAPYVRPLKLYLLAALVSSLAVLAFWPDTAPRVVRAPSSSGQIDSWQDRGLQKMEEDPKRFGEALTANLQRALFLLLPVFALLLKLLYVRRGIHYLSHLVFALHWHAFAFVSLGVLVLIAAAGLPPLAAKSISTAIWLWIFVYLLFALRRVYGDSWPRTGLRFATLLISYGAVLTLAVVGLTMLTFYRMGVS